MANTSETQNASALKANIRRRIAASLRFQRNAISRQYAKDSLAIFRQHYSYAF